MPDRDAMRPPRLARALLRMAAPRDDRPFVLADVDGEFTRMTEHADPAAARRWYWRQALHSVAPLIASRVNGRWTVPRAASAVDDARQGVRWVARHRWTSAVVILTLGLAFGAGLAALAVADAAVFNPLPYPDADRLVRVWTTGPSRPAAVRAVSRPDFLDWRDRTRSFAALSAYAPHAFRLTDRGEPKELDAVRVERDLERVLGIVPMLGRAFTGADFTPGGRRVAILQHAFWLREFGGDRAAVGRRLLLDEEPYEIVGVLPASRAPLPLERHDVWVPLVPRAGVFWEASRATGWLIAIGRLNAGVAPAAAEADLTAVARSLERAFPASNDGKSAGRAAPLAEEIAGPIAPVLALLATAIAAVLLIACGNIASLLLASFAERRREFAVRAALGAGRARLARQVLAENLLLCLLGGALGLAIAPPLARLFVALYPSVMPGAAGFAVDPMLALACAAASAATAIVLTIPQAAAARHAAAPAGLSSRHTAPRAQRAMRHALVTLQVALSFVLLVAGVALSRSVARLAALDPGFSAAGVLTFTLTPSRQTVSSAAQALAFYESVVDAVRGVPGVRAAAAAIGAPLTVSGHRFGVRPPGSSADLLVTVNHASEAYFETLGMRLREGRLLTAAEHRDARVVVINTPLARALTGGRSPLGLRLPYARESWEIVGVVEGVRQLPLRDPAPPEIYLPWRLAGARPQAIVVRTAGDPLAVLPAIAARVHAIDPSVPLGRPATLDSRLADARRAEVFRASLVTALATLALALAALGAYSVTAHAVSQRGREYGIRLALGERPASIARRALGTAVSPAVTGIVLGGAAAAAAGRWMQAFLFGVSARDAATFAAAAALLLVLALLAAGRSALAASRTDPVNALRLDT